MDLSLDFAEMDSPVHWTVENFFQCVGKYGTLKACLLVSYKVEFPALGSFSMTDFYFISWDGRAATSRQLSDSVRHAAGTG